MWHTEGFDNKMGAVLDGLRKDTRFSIFYPVFFMIRRTVFAAQAVFFPQYFSIQIITQIELTMVQIMYLLKFKPFEEELNGNLEIMNECFTLILMFHIMCLN